MPALVPLNDARLLGRLLEAGVEQVYLGFHDDAWTERFGDAELNRMSGFGREANPFSFEEMCEQARRANGLGMAAFACFNASAYTDEQIAFIEGSYLPAIAQAGGAGVILSNQALIGAARSAGLHAVVSTLAGVFNERLAAYYRDCGASRVILPRDLSADEIGSIMHAVPQVEYEVFLMRNGCMFSDSHCLGCHRGGQPSLCLSLREGETDIGLADASGSREWHSRQDAAGAGREAGFLERVRRNEWMFNRHFHRRTCGLCALWRFERLGVAAYKVVGRGDDGDDLVADAGLVVRNASLARRCATEEDYLASMELPREPQTLCGMGGLSCYYPEVSRATRRP